MPDSRAVGDSPFNQGRSRVDPVTEISLNRTELCGVEVDGTGAVLLDPADSVYTFLRSEAVKELSPDALGAIPEPS